MRKKQKIKKLTQEEILSLSEKTYSLRDSNFKLLAMYSSLWHGVTLDPKMMSLPIDDHMVHRGDGVFETFRVCCHSAYDIDAHLQRLSHSLKFLGLECPKSLKEIKGLCQEMIEMLSLEEALVRLFVSRGPGGFTLNPKESIGSQLYIVFTNFQPLSEEVYFKGIRVIQSQIPVKQRPFCGIKSCNYLHNVLMKKEALEKKADFAVNVTEEGYLSEGASENVALISKDNELLFPSFDYTLKGTTAEKIMKLAQALVKEGSLSSIRNEDVPLQILRKAKEAFLIGTTVEVLSISEFEGQKIGQGQRGPIAKRLRLFLQEDMKKQALNAKV